MPNRATAMRRNAHTGTAIGASLRSTVSIEFSFSVGVVVIDVGGGRQAVLAAVAVHAGLAGERFAVTLEDEVDDSGVDAQVGGHRGPVRTGLFADAVDEHAGEEEVGDDGDAVGA